MIQNKYANKPKQLKITLLLILINFLNNCFFFVEKSENPLFEKHVYTRQPNFKIQHRFNTEKERVSDTHRENADMHRHTS